MLEQAKVSTELVEKPHWTNWEGQKYCASGVPCMKTATRHQEQQQRQLLPTLLHS
jgi:hypothetical protein